MDKQLSLFNDIDDLELPGTEVDPMLKINKTDISMYWFRELKPNNDRGVGVGYRLKFSRNSSAPIRWRGR